ncbi:hypothetical protein HanPI659440_Chr06g0226731 [Helianthus annuus]|nr:hypothetical protein HanPI659440_Chr06g0226731 [Helianthus annuus]
MIGFSESSGSVWRIEVTKAKHNHTPIENFEGHAYARRLSSEDKKLVKELAEQDIPNQSIWRTLTKNNPARKLIPKDIHNAVQKINAEKNVGMDSSDDEIEHMEAEGEVGDEGEPACPYLQFPQGSRARGSCARLRTIQIGEHVGIDWELLDTVGEVARARDVTPPKSTCG